jgi:hypothetical protein
VAADIVDARVIFGALMGAIFWNLGLKLINHVHVSVP